MIKNKRRMLTSWAITLVMALNAFLPFNTAWTRADGAEQGKDVTGTLTGLNATVTQNGKEIGENGTLTTDDISVKVSFGVPVEGDNLPEGVVVVEKNDTATFDLSKGFTLKSDPGKSVELRTKTDGGILVGHVSFSTNSETKMVTATVTFDGKDQVFNGDCNSVSCEFNASLAYDKSGDAGSTGDHNVQILNKIFTVNVPAPEIQYGMEKSGTADLANKCIHWTATVTATQGDQNIDLGGYTFSDDLTSVGEYSEGTFKAGGSSETAVSPSSGFSSENNKLTYTFPAGTTSPQTVTFDTAIPDDMCYAEGWEQTVSNTARLLDSENNIKAQKPAVVTFTPTWIEKQGVPNYNNENGNSGIYDPKNRTITWTITANQYGAALPGAYITDPLPHDLTLVSATAQTWNGSDWVESPIQKWTEAPTD